MDIQKDYNIDQAIINKYLPYLDLVGLPSDVTISTITLTCSFNTEFIIKNISKYLKQSSLPEKKRRKKNQKRKKFYNQETLIYRSKILNNKINVKIFKNGSLQITGSRSLENFLEIMIIVCNQLKNIKIIYKDNKIVTKNFATDPEQVDIMKINNIKIQLINSNYTVNFNVDRPKLDHLLKINNYNSSFEPWFHAAVKIKYHVGDNRKVSVFVFEKGAIIITGSNNKNDLIKAYNFINEFLFDNFKDILSSSLEDYIKYPEIIELLQRHNI